eukprot:TRINITY_DN4604_c0_g1_i7.p1 TRINITY_DN4604_c0_g1~~TRINITY_DN4604_c0_g1_i7.p1  ORF type:complete len:293 (-),score=46.59 TRINITY_DN4604_c0_g1_i7:62-940(-)
MWLVYCEQWPDFGCEGIKVQRAHQPTSQCQGKKINKNKKSSESAKQKKNKAKIETEAQIDQKDSVSKSEIQSKEQLNTKDQDGKRRCGWSTVYTGALSDLYVQYHDLEWGRPLYNDDRALFELLNLESAQAGLSWSTILNKRENYRVQFDNFDIITVSKYDQQKIDQLLFTDSGIVRNKLKVLATITNAKQVLQIQEEFGSFSDYIWGFMPDKKPMNNSWKFLEECPSKTDLSEKMSRDLKKRGFKFVGPTTCYSFMQGAGLVNDHTVHCFCYQEVLKIQQELFGEKQSLQS